MAQLSSQDDLYRFFGLDHPAFGPITEVGQIFRSGLAGPVVKEILAGSPILTIRGGTGVGKTAFMHVLAGELESRALAVALVEGQAASPDDVQGLIAQAGGLTRSAMAPEVLLRTLSREAGVKRLVLLCDNADTLPEATFRYISLLLKLRLAQPVAVQVVFLGETGTWPGLDAPELEQMRRATTSAYITLSLRKSEAAAYLGHRLKYAGQTLERVMAPSAVTELSDLAQCNPRRLDELAQRALLYGYRTGRRRLTGRSVRRALVADGAVAPRGRAWRVAGAAAAVMVVAVAGAAMWFETGSAPVAVTPLAPVAVLSKPVVTVPTPAPVQTRTVAAVQPRLAPPSRAVTAPVRPVAPAAPAPVDRGTPGLVLVAGPRDTMPTLYARVYRGLTPPPYSAVLAVNQEPVRPGALVIFPEPPGGWTRR